jgi:hypothetical protein
MRENLNIIVVLLNLMKIPVIFVEPPLGAVGYPGGLVQKSFVDSLSAESKRYLEVFGIGAIG